MFPTFPLQRDQLCLWDWLKDAPLKDVECCLALALRIESLYNGYVNPYYWVDEIPPYHMEIMQV